MDKIVAKGLTFRGYHGLLEAEQKTVQEFKVDITMYLDLKKAGNSDDIHDTVDYASVYSDVRDIVEKKSFRLLEALCANIAEKIMDTYEITEIEVIVYKPQAPMIENIDYFAVAITRKKN